MYLEPRHLITCTLKELTEQNKLTNSKAHTVIYVRIKGLPLSQLVSPI